MLRQWRHLYACVNQQTIFRLMNNDFVFLSLKCFTHTPKDGPWNGGAHLCWRTNFSDCLNTNSSAVVLFGFAGKILASQLLSMDVIYISKLTLSLNLYSASLWYNRKYSQARITLAIWKKGELRNRTTCLFAVLHYLQNFVLQVYFVICNCFIETVSLGRTQFTIYQPSHFIELLIK